MFNRISKILHTEKHEKIWNYSQCKWRPLSDVNTFGHPIPGQKSSIALTTNKPLIFLNNIMLALKGSKWVDYLKAKYLQLSVICPSCACKY